SHLILPVLFGELEEAGISKDSVTVIIGVGNHRPVTEQEKAALLGPLYGQVRCFHSRETGYTLLGITKRGTPVEVSVPLAQADLVVALGNIEIHQLAGYTGGVKAVAVGAASHSALEHNHRLSTLGESGPGLLEENIVRHDMEEFARIANLGFILNVVINETGQVVHLVAGDPIDAHRIGCIAAEKMYRVRISEAADIVIVSPGGEPKDNTVYQAQKTVQNALKAVKDGGIIIVAAKCPEGLGDPVFEEWMNQASSPGDIEGRSRREFVLGGHKAAFLAGAVKKARIFWVSGLLPATVRKLFFEPYKSLQAAVNTACEIKGSEARVLVIPWGGITVPQPGEG
ncbi:MAG: nickel-dependent lactate racemase family protein, partial [Eubacteriales bacterium]